jgi:hypothetical protein
MRAIVARIRTSPARAASIVAMSLFFIVIIASIARLAAAVSGSLIASINTRGVICHLNPNRCRRGDRARVESSHSPKSGDEGEPPGNSIGLRIYP